MYRPRTWAEIDLGAIRDNMRSVLSRLGPETGVMAVVKADAYGHGAVPVARSALEAGAHALAVGDSGEAIELRESPWTGRHARSNDETFLLWHHLPKSGI